MPNINLNPYPESKDGGKIEVIGEGMKPRDYQIEVSPKAQEILERIPQEKRVQYLFESTEPELEQERKQLFEKLGIKRRTPYEGYDYE